MNEEDTLTQEDKKILCGALDAMITACEVNKQYKWVEKYTAIKEKIEKTIQK